MSDFAEALANPIKYQSELEKRAEQLAVLMEEITPSEDDCASSCKSIFSKNFFFVIHPIVCSKSSSLEAIDFLLSGSIALCSQFFDFQCELYRSRNSFDIRML